MELPIVTVIIPVYNRQKYIQEAIESILSQSYRNLELLVVNDASTDDTLKLISQIKDSRIKIINLPINKGVSAAFNLGISMAKGKFIARLDSDDIAALDRIETQVNFFQSNQTFSICGSWLVRMNSQQILEFPTADEEIRTTLLHRCPISIGTSMFKKEIFNQFKFNETLRYSEDYEFWSRVLFKYKAFNIPQVLVYYRQHDNQLTNIYWQEQFFTDVKIKLSLLKKLNYDQVRFPDDLIINFWNHNHEYLLEQVLSFFCLTSHLKKINNKEKIFPTKEFRNKMKIWRLKMILKIFFGINPALKNIDRLKILTFLEPSEVNFVVYKKLKQKMGFLK